MICNCGRMTTDQQHEVKTLAKAQEWNASIIESDLPIMVYQDKCGSCGRIHKIVKTKNGEIKR